MSRRCKPGIRARILSKGNKGKIVLVVRHYCGETVSDATWPTALFPWVVTSLGGTLRCFEVDTLKECPPTMTIVMDDRDLEPLRDDDDPESESEVLNVPLQVPSVAKA